MQLPTRSEVACCDREGAHNVLSRPNRSDTGMTSSAHGRYSRLDCGKNGTATRNTSISDAIIASHQSRLRKSISLSVVLLCVTVVGSAYGGESIVSTVKEYSDLSSSFSRPLQDNQPPVITGQNPVSTNEDSPVTIESAHLIVSDPDDVWPTDFTIQAQPGEHYSLSELTVIPEADFFGTLSVPVTVNDGQLASAVFSLQITVNAVNDPPVITGQTPDPLPLGQGQSTTLALGNFLVTDPDNTFPDEFSLTVLEGGNYSVNGTSIQPAQGFSGNLTVNVTVNDPGANSEVYGFRVTVTPNSPPVITGQTELSTQEETPLAISLSNLTVSDPDNVFPADFTLELLPGENYSLNGNTVVPSKDFAGNLSVPAVVRDGVNGSDPFALQVTVHNVNDPPVITGQTPLSIPENQSITIDVSQLAISDPDNESFTLSVLEGNNYTLSGTTVTPSPGFSGDLSIKVFVSDGAAASNEFNVIVTVSPVNDPPVITGQQRTLEISEGGAIGLSLADVTVTDPDNAFPQGFTLTVLAGENYTVSGNLVSPHPDFSGQLSVNVTVSDGTNESAPFTLVITVVPVNDAPIITGQQPVSTPEETARTITLGDLVVSDADNNYPDGFSLTVFPGGNYALEGNTVVPAANFSGTLNVQVQVSDGALTSNIFTLRVDVTAVNDKPVITGQVPLQTQEDVPVAIQLSHLTVLDPDNSYPTGFSLAILPGTNYTVSGTTVIPSADFNGTLNVTITVSDGMAVSDPFTLQIQVGDANDAPVITGQTPLSTNEEQPVTIALSHLTVSDPDNPYPTGFSLTVSPGANYTVSGTTVTPSLNFAGTLTVPLRVSDGVNNSPSFNFQLQVNQVNDPPSFAAIPNQKVAENAPPASIVITGVSKGPREDDQQLMFSALSGNPAVIGNPNVQYDGTSSTATLSYTVNPDVSGVVTIAVTATDNGSNVAPNQNSYSSSFQIEVVPVNDAPTLDAVNAITIAEDAGEQNINLTGITAGPGENQELSVFVSTDKPQWFEVLQVAYTSPASTALLQFRVKDNVNGTAELALTVKDNGSDVPPHVNTITRKVTLTIQPVNDIPVITSQALTLAVVGELYQYNLRASDPDGGAVSLSAIAKPTWLNLTSVNGGALLQGTPPPGTVGEHAVVLRAADAMSYVDQSFTLFVNIRPNVQESGVFTNEDTALQLSASFFTSSYSDPNNDPLTAIRITALPRSGHLILAGSQVGLGDTLQAESLAQLVYMPQQNFYGSDLFAWHAFDGRHFSVSPANVDIIILPVNDLPRVVLQHDSIQYEVNGEPALVAPLIDIFDPDDDTLSSATMTFNAISYRPEMDVLEFDATANVRGRFDLQRGALLLTGVASIDEYRTALRSIRYTHLNTLDPILEPKRLGFLLSDRDGGGENIEQVIMLQYTFIEFDIPSAFTPNGDNANDVWIIDRPGGGLEELDDAIISIYNRHGVLVHRARGFETPWDGTMNGELLPADTYYFTIDLQLRNKKTYKGTVTILR